MFTIMNQNKLPKQFNLIAYSLAVRLIILDMVDKKSVTELSFIRKYGC